MSELKKGLMSGDSGAFGGVAEEFDFLYNRLQKTIVDLQKTPSGGARPAPPFATGNAPAASVLLRPPPRARKVQFFRAAVPRATAARRGEGALRGWGPGSRLNIVAFLC